MFELPAEVLLRAGTVCLFRARSIAIGPGINTCKGGRAPWNSISCRSGTWTEEKLSVRGPRRTKAGGGSLTTSMVSRQPPHSTICGPSTEQIGGLKGALL